MRIGSLIVLGAVFLSAFAGRAAVLAARTDAAEASAPEEAGRRDCVTGALADEIRAQARRLELAEIDFRSEERKRAVLLDHVNERIAELERLNSELAATAARQGREAAGGAEKVAGLYERMKPDRAGAVLGAMDPKFAAGLLAAMKPESAAGILAAIAPERAYAITVVMTERS